MQFSLTVPTVRDRIVQTALVHTIEPILDATFHPRSFGFRHGRGCHDALRCVEELLEAGYSFRGKLRFPRDKSHRKFLHRLRALTPRKSGESLDVMIQRINRSTRGWFNYFRHCHWNIFKDYDGLIRRRLRRLLLKRNRRNRKRLPRHQRWPNAYFTKHGFVSLNELHIRFVQSTGTY